MESNKIDLSPLDPSRDQERWNYLIESVSTRAIDARRRRMSINFKLIAWARPAIALASAAAIISVVGASLTPKQSELERFANAKVPRMLTVWTTAGKTAPAAIILEILGGKYGSK